MLACCNSASRSVKERKRQDVLAFTKHKNHPAVIELGDGKTPPPYPDVQYIWLMKLSWIKSNQTDVIVFHPT